MVNLTIKVENMNWISNIWKFLINPKNRRMIILAVFIVFGVLFFKQCNSIKGLKEDIKTEQVETQRIQNNYDASRDSVDILITQSGALRGQIDGYILTIDELNNKYSDLFGEYQKEKNKKPKTIIKYIVQLKEDIKEIPIYVSDDSIGNKSLNFIDSVNYKEGNKRWLSGKIPYQLNYYNLPDSIIQYSDSINYYANVIPGFGNFILKQNISLTTGLSIDKTTNKPIIWVETKYPGITFPTIIGAQITDDPISKKVAKEFRKEFGIGFTVGYGLVLQNKAYNNGIMIGVGVTYTPRWLQFGK
jgi:hypothetical protein